MAYTTIKDPSAYFQTKLYTGGTVGAKTFDGNANLKPDLFWSKKRGAVQNHFLADSVRGTTYAISSNTTAASYTNSETADLASFDTNGFTFSGTGDTYNGTYQSDSYVAWSWSAAGNSGVANTDGTISSTVSANTTSGFSIVSYTGTGSGATVGHGLGVAPKVIFFKNRDIVQNWVTYHEPLGFNSFLKLNTSDASASNTLFMNNSAPTSSVFSLGTFTNNNGSGDSHIAYCFAEKQGFSKFGSYVGNGNADGTFVYTGFKPAWLLVKRTDSATAWKLLDNKRNPNNDGSGANLNASDDSAEDDNTVYAVDFLSNGFKIRNTNGNFNTSGGTFIYTAFAEEPLVGDNPATAR